MFLINEYNGPNKFPYYAYIGVIRNERFLTFATIFVSWKLEIEKERENELKIEIKTLLF